ncbi:DUF998 domain-containing protein [Palaeococcus ferrophilus]|uniref:DUF998 domain-containing protein n=1 Tax=Palaeococcus ferrophilus TaxID=83868 RepID=UPI00064F584E|nr:DUF998 domain-containing protein [Palaeococcus ferrophilus]
MRRFYVYASLSIPLLFVVGLLFVISQNPWFSLTDNALSDMGSLHNPKGYLFNGFIMLLATVMFVVSVGMAREGYSYLMPIASLFLFLVGVFPEEKAPHAPAAILFYTTALADIALVGGKKGKRGWSALAVVTFALMLVLPLLVRGLAIPELVGAATITGWFLYLGLMFRGQKRF